jgi:DNA topoisomerase II
MKDDEDEALELKDGLAVYNFDDSPPEHSGNTHVLCTAKYSYLLQKFYADHLQCYVCAAIKTETTEGQQEGKKWKNDPNKRGAANKATAPLTELSGENEDNKFAVEEVQVEKKTGGRKPAAQKPKKTTNRKRALAQSNSGNPSPEKVRKMGDSSFNKKSGLVAQTVASASTATEDVEAPLPSGSSAQPVAPRRSARLKQSTSID